MTTVSATLECYADTGYLLINAAIAAEFREFSRDDQRWAGGQLAEGLTG
jgi:hypothetical protein